MQEIATTKPVCFTSISKEIGAVKEKGINKGYSLRRRYSRPPACSILLKEIKKNLSFLERVEFF